MNHSYMPQLTRGYSAYSLRQFAVSRVDELRNKFKLNCQEVSDAVDKLVWILRQAENSLPQRERGVTNGHCNVLSGEVRLAIGFTPAADVYYKICFHVCNGAILDEDELLELQTYAKREGRHWKRSLNQAWFSASEPGILQEIRNRLGPTWLTKFKLPKETA